MITFFSFSDRADLKSHMHAIPTGEIHSHFYPDIAGDDRVREQFASLPTGANETGIDPASFTFVRIFSGAVALWLIMKMRRGMIALAPQSSPKGRGDSFFLQEKVGLREAGNWFSALALFIYAAAFSFAYLDLSAGTGALLLFGAVQATMILWGFHKGERLDAIQIVGFIVAVIGLVVLVFPGLTAPPLFGSILMLGAGVAWGIYSLRGKARKKSGQRDRWEFSPRGSICRCCQYHFLSVGTTRSRRNLLRLISGAITSGLGYVIWYSALPGLKAASAATVQLSVRSSPPLAEYFCLASRSLCVISSRQSPS